MFLKSDNDIVSNENGRERQSGVVLEHFIETVYPVIPGQQVHFNAVVRDAAFIEKLLGGLAMAAGAEGIDSDF